VPAGPAATGLAAATAAVLVVAAGRVVAAAPAAGQIQRFAYDTRPIGSAAPSR
jgi:hypothetical protein